MDQTQVILDMIEKNRKALLDEIKSVKNTVNYIKSRLFIEKDNGDPPLAEQIHLNTEHRKCFEDQAKWYQRSWFQILVTGIVTAGLSVFLFITFGIK